jgi:hypothetical protein
MPSMLRLLSAVQSGVGWYLVRAVSRHTRSRISPSHSGMIIFAFGHDLNLMNAKLYSMTKNSLDSRFFSYAKPSK